MACGSNSGCGCGGLCKTGVAYSFEEFTDDFSTGFSTTLGVAIALIAVGAVGTVVMGTYDRRGSRRR